MSRVRSEKCDSSNAQSGFALIITIAVLAMLTVVLFALSALGRVGTSISATAACQTQARQHALLAFRVALGELQMAAGADNRITGMAGITGVPAGAGNAARHWCGVWDGSGGFQQWLVSGIEGESILMLAGDSIAMVASGPLGADGSDKEYVRALLVPLVINSRASEPVTLGNYAWWVGDEGVKLSAVIPDAEAPVVGEKHAIDELLPALSPTAPGLLAVDAYAQIALAVTPALTPGQLQANFHSLGRTHHALVGEKLYAGMLNINTTNSRFWRGLAATYNRANPTHALALSPAAFGSRVQSDFVSDATSGKDAGGPYLSVGAFLGSPLMAAVLSDSGVAPEEFGAVMERWLAVRSDTFRIRAYGSALNPSDPQQVEAEAWCEAVVQRTPEIAVGNIRRFKVDSFRWLGTDDI